MDKITALEKYPKTKLINITFAGESSPIQAVVDSMHALGGVYRQFAGKVQIKDDKTYCSFGRRKHIPVSRKTGEYLSLIPYWDEDEEKIKEKLGGLYFIVFRTVSSNFTAIKGIVVRNTGRGYFIEEISPSSYPVISTDVMAVACYEALAAGNIIKRHSKNYNGVLAVYSLIVQIGIVSNQLRLDHALNALKVVGHSTDAYGEKIKGIIQYHSEMKSRDRKWKIIYDVEDDGSVNQNDVASVDHVRAKSVGGEDHLVNMHIMRMVANSRKGSEKTDIVADPAQTLEVLSVMEQGVLAAFENGNMKNELADELLGVIKDEYDACYRASRELVSKYTNDAKTSLRKSKGVANILRAWRRT